MFVLGDKTLPQSSPTRPCDFNDAVEENLATLVLYKFRHDALYAQPMRLHHVPQESLDLMPAPMLHCLGDHTVGIKATLCGGAAQAASIALLHVSRSKLVR